MKINTENMLPIRLAKMPNGDVTGTLPSGHVVTWPADHSNKPTYRNKRIMVNCCWWRLEWETVK